MTALGPEEIRTRVESDFNRIVDVLNQKIALQSISAKGITADHMKRSAQFVADLLREVGVDTKVVQSHNPDGTPGEPQKLAEYFAISEDKLKALPAEKLVELRDNGALGQIYAHLVSLLGWDRLIALAFQRQAEAPASVN